MDAEVTEVAVVDMVVAAMAVVVEDMVLRVAAMVLQEVATAVAATVLPAQGQLLQHFYTNLFLTSTPVTEVAIAVVVGAITPTRLDLFSPFSGLRVSE